MIPETILKEKYNLELNAPSEPEGMYTTVVQTGELLYVCGHTPKLNGNLVSWGRLGAEVTLEEGQYAARIAAVNCLEALKNYLGELNKIKKFIQVVGFVRSTEDFTDQPLVINGASSLFLEVFGERGKHTRMAIGTNQLPGGASVEVMCIVQV
ncbi:RidA family protein [Desulfosporosinus sp. PR]|uniref:RidA family protein n=1 Tax=Candidatus Desulfosporosinus nitrosoreducens TaxID=3401928 RepID=UPI0027EC9073|nr:RidA family protein [Desulfosporosinus sp. PR]MDQ7093526.1 RidA family protein [Desulfosporosinus sp. PR]